MAANEDRKRLRKARKQLGIKRQEIATIRAEIKELAEKVRVNPNVEPESEVTETSSS